MIKYLKKESQRKKGAREMGGSWGVISLLIFHICMLKVTI